MAEKPKVTWLRFEALVWVLLITFVLGALLIITISEQHAMSTELEKRPAIGYPVFRGEYTVMIMNMDLHEVYWFTNCPRLQDFTRYEEVAIYGDHRNRCHDWRTLTPSEHEISRK